MGFHATINAGTDAFGNNKIKRAPRVRVTDKRWTSNAVQTGNDTRVILNGVADKRGYMGATTPLTAPYDIASPALGREFSSALAKSIVTRGEWRKDEHGWKIATQRHGLLRVVKGTVMLNRDKLGCIDMSTLTSKAGRDSLITMVIAGTVPQVMIKRDKPKAEKRERVETVNPVYFIYATRDGRKIKYRVPEGGQPVDIIDDMTDKGWTIVKIDNQ